MKKKAKRILSYFMMIVMFVFLFSGVNITNASANERFSTENGYLEYRVKDNNEITITDYSGTDEELSIPSKIDGKSVTSIGERAFQYCDMLKNITIPDSLTSIDSYAFDGCSDLENIRIPNSVTKIGDRAFRDCNSLTNIIIPNSIRKIDKDTFLGCSKLTEIVIPDSVTSIDHGAFSYCTSLKNIKISNSLTSIGSDAFYCCENITNLTIPNSVKDINSRAFWGCISLRSITIPDSVEVINSETFRYCESLTNIVIPNSVTSIGLDVFAGCTSLTSITIPDSVTNMGSGIFSYCTNLRNITISNSISSIESCAFYGCTSLTSIIIPNSVKYLGSCAFYNCKDLEEIILSKSMNCISEMVFQNCTNLMKITIPNSVTKIGNQAFYNCNNLTNLTIPNSVTSIGDNAFARCYNLTISGYKNSYAETYAKENSIPFEEITSSNLSISSFTASKQSPQYTGTSVKLTTQASGGIGSLQYKYYRYLNGNYATIKDWSTTNNVTITPTTEGTYDLWVAVKDSEGTIIKKNIKFTFDKALGINSFTTDKVSPQYVGTSVKLTTQASGGIGTLQYKYYRYLNGSYATIKDWSTTNNVTITPSTEGTYDLWVAVKDSEGTMIKKNIKFTFDKALGINSFIADKVSPQYTKTSVKLTVQAVGGKGTKQYKYYRYLNGIYKDIKDWSTTNNVTINPSTTGTYDLWVAVKDETGKIVKKNISFTFTKPLGISSMTTDKQSPQYTGTSVKLTTQASGGIGSLQYKYYSYLNGSYATIKDWSTTNNVTITPSTEGTYDLWVAVKDSKGTMIKKNIKFIFDKALGINSFTTDKVSPQYVGTSVKLTVQAVGGKGTKEYKYYRYLNGNYADIKDWSTSSSVTIAPKTEGTYDLWVAVKDSTGKIVKKNIKFSFNKVLEVNSLTTDKVSPQYVESSINITAKVSGGIGTLQYRFRVGNPDGTYSIIKDYSTSNTATWKANYIGSKILYVDVKDSRGKIVTKSVNYTIKAKPLEINSFTTDKSSPQYKGSSIKMTASASGGEGTLQYRFRAGNPDGSYSVVKDYSTTNTVVWTANYSGSKILYVDVKDSKGSVVTKSINYSIKEKPVINSFTTDKNSPQNLGTTIKLTANVSGGANLQYKFSVQGEDGNTITLKDYSSSNTYNWTPSKDGNQTLYVDVKDSLGVTLRKSINYNIIFVCKVNTEDFRKAVGDEMYRLVNEHRNNNGVASFTVDSVMEECAYDKSKHMSDNNYFSHDYNGKYWWDMYPEKYANWSNLGENIVLSSTDPNKVYTREECKEIAEDLFTAWKNSPGHNANMLNSSFKQIGFGIYVNSSGKVYATQEFITRFY